MTATDKLSPLEKAARAAFEAYRDRAYTDPSRHPEAERVWTEGKEGFIDAARAVLLAVRAAEIEMTEEIMQNFADPCWDEDARLGFTAMIDAILAGE